MLSGISIWQLLIILVIIMLLFGTKKLRNVGKDLGGAVKGFKDAVKEGEEEQQQLDSAKKENQGETIDQPKQEQQDKS